MLPQSQALEVPVADKRQGKYETDRDEMPVHNIVEGSESQDSVTRPLRAESQDPDGWKARHLFNETELKPSPYLPGLKSGVSRRH
jgi:hypothetical protein